MACHKRRMFSINKYKSIDYVYEDNHYTENQPIGIDQQGRQKNPGSSSVKIPSSMAEVPLSKALTLTPQYSRDYYHPIATARRKMTMSCLALPLPFNISTDQIYLHSGVLPDDNYRMSWIRGKVVPGSRLDMNGSVLEQLRCTVLPMQPLEKMNAALTLIAGGVLEIVPSSNPDSQAYPETEEALWLATPAAAKRNSCLVDDFTKAHLQTSSEEDHESLRLEELMVSPHVHQFRKHMPTLQAKLSRLKPLLLADPLRMPMGGTLSEDLIFGRCVPYDATSCDDADGSQMRSTYIEEYSRVAPREKETLMLLEVESSSTLKVSFSTSVVHLTSVLEVHTVQEEDPMSSVNLLRNANPAGLEEIHPFVASSSHGNNLSPLPADDLRAPAPQRLYPQLELDELLSSDNRPRLPELGLSSSHLQPEPLPPVHSHYLLSASEREEMERGVWTAEKHHNSRASFLLAEPPSRKPFVLKRLLENAFEVLAIPTSPQEIGLDGRPQIPFKGHLNFVEKGTPHPLSVMRSDLLDDFTVLSGAEIDDVLRGNCEDVDKPKIPLGTSAKSSPHQQRQSQSQRPTIPMQQGAVQQVAVSSQQEEGGRAVKKLIMERMGGGERPSDVIVSPSQEDRPLALPLIPLQGSHGTMGKEMVDNTSTGRKPHTSNEFPRSKATASKPRSHFDLLDSFILLRQQQGMLGTSEKATELQSKMLAKQQQQSTDPRLGERGGQQKGVVAAPAPAAMSGPGERSRTCSTTQGTPSSTSGLGASTASTANTPAGQTPLANTSVSQTSGLSTVTGQAGALSAAVSAIAASHDHSRGASIPTGPASQVSSTTTALLTDDKRQDMPGIQETGSGQDNSRSRVIPVQATESQLLALREVCALGEPCLSRALAMGLSATGGCRDFSSLDTERSHFLLKQQQKQLASNPDLEQLYVEVALLHTLATVKELLLQCGVSNACDYLAKAKKAHETEELDRLHKRVLLLQCLGQKNSEPDPKLTQLQDVMSTWLQAVSTRPGLSKVLLLTSTDVDSVRSLLIGSLNQISGEGVVDAVVPTGDSSYVDGKKVLNCLRCSSWVVVCSQHLGPDFPWSSFSQVVEYEGLASSPWPSICRERNIRHVSFTTVLPTSETGGVVFPTSSSDLDRIPFTLFVTEGLLGRSSLLLTLESEYNLTMIERSLSPSLKKLGKADQCAVITVDESTAVLLQEVKELAVERASEQVVMRLIGLSLQYTCCWLLIHIPSAEYACISQVILDNLALIYSAVVLLGMKSEEFTVKVLVVSEEEQLARWIYQIAQHTMMSSERDPLAYLDRDWLSVVPSEEENCLVCFPSVSPLVAQTMLHRAPSLLWLLGASLDQLQQLLPEVPQKVIKLFTETSGLYALGPSPHRPESVPDPESQHRPQPGLPETGQATGYTSSSSNSTHEHWALTIENSPEEDQTTSCFGQTQNNTGQDGVALFGSSGTGQADAFFQRIENLGQTKETNGGLSDDVWASALKKKPAEELSGAYYSHEPQRDGFLLNNTAVGERQGDALFHKATGNFVQTGNFGTSPSEAFFDKNNGWREKKSFSPSPNGVFQRQEENGKTVRGHQGDSLYHKGSGNFGVSPTDSFFDKINGWREKDSSSPSPNGVFQRQEEDRGKTVSFTAGQSYSDFERRADFPQAGNSSVRQSDACFDGKESWEQTDRFNAGQSATDFMRQENSGKTGHFGTGQNSELYPGTGNFDQTVNLSAGPSDDVFSRNKITGWGLTSQSSGASALFQSQEAWGKIDESQFNSGITSRQSDSYFDQTEGWGHMARSDPVHSQWNPFLQSNKDRWEQTGNFSTGCQSDTSFPWKESFAQTGNSVGLGHDVFLPHSGRNNTWDKNSGHAELGFPSATFRSPTETTATTASRQQQAQAQPKQWHMEINKHKYVPRKKVPARGGSTLRISPKQDDQGTRDAQDNNSNSSMFQQQFANGCQPSSYYQDHVTGSLPVGPVNSVCSSPVSRWTGQFMAEAYRLSPGNSVGSATRMEQDRKRRAGMSSLESPASGFPQTKKGKLFYERVPGRSDGQTRLKFY